MIKELFLTQHFHKVNFDLYTTNSDSIYPHQSKLLRTPFGIYFEQLREVILYVVMPRYRRQSLEA
jgi:hypothetical protein